MGVEVQLGGQPLQITIGDAEVEVRIGENTAAAADAAARAAIAAAEAEAWAHGHQPDGPGSFSSREFSEASAASAASAANSASLAAAAIAAGTAATYATKADALADIGSIASGDFVQVLIDESFHGLHTVYVNDSGALVFVRRLSPESVTLEEFGGKADDPDFDNAAAWNAASATGRPIELLGDYAISRAWLLAGTVFYSTCGGRLRPYGGVDTTDNVFAGDFVETAFKNSVLFALGSFVMSGVTLHDPDQLRDLVDPHDWTQPLHLTTDARFTASISGNVMTVTDVASGTIVPGTQVRAANFPTGVVVTEDKAANGSRTGEGGTGTYTISDAPDTGSTEFFSAKVLWPVAASAVPTKKFDDGTPYWGNCDYWTPAVSNGGTHDPAVNKGPLQERYFIRGHGIDTVHVINCAEDNLGCTAIDLVNVKHPRVKGWRSTNCRGPRTTAGLPILSDERGSSLAILGHPQFPKPWEGPHVDDVLIEDISGEGVRGNVAVFTAAIAAGTGHTGVTRSIMNVSAVASGRLELGMEMPGLRTSSGSPVVIIGDASTDPELTGEGGTGTYRLSKGYTSPIDSATYRAENVMAGVWQSREELGRLHGVGSASIGFSHWGDVDIDRVRADGFRRSAVLMGTEAHRDPQQKSRRARIRNVFATNCGQQGVKWKSGYDTVTDDITVDGFELTKVELPGNHEAAVYLQLTAESQADNIKAYGRARCLGEIMADELVAGGDSTRQLTLSAIDEGHPLYNHVYAPIAYSSSQYVGAPERHQLVGRFVVIVAGTGAGQWRQIAAFDPDTLTISISSPAGTSTWDVEPDETSRIEIWTMPRCVVKVEGNPAEATGVAVEEGEGPTLSNWSQPDGANCFQIGKVMGFGVRDVIVFNEPLFECHVGSIIGHNCHRSFSFQSNGVSTPEATTYNTRAVRMDHVENRWIDLPFINGGSDASRVTDAVTIGNPDGYVRDVSVGYLAIDGAIGSGLAILSAGRTRIGGGFIRNCGRGKQADGTTAFTTTVGIRLNNAPDCRITDFDVSDVDFAISFSGDSDTGFIWNGGSASAAIQPIRLTDTDDPPNDAQFINVRGVGAQPGVTMLADADVTLNPGTARALNILDTTLTGNRAVTLGTAGAVTGMTLHFVRTTAATGAFNYSIGGLANLAPGTECKVAFVAPLSGPLDAGAWVLIAYGSLS